MFATSGVTIQFGAKPLFENITVKFEENNRYGLIGANGCGKSTLMKILGGDLEPTAGQVLKDPHKRLGKLKQDYFSYENMRVLDVVMMGHVEMWQAMTERDAIYANLEATEEDYIKAADLEAKFAECDGYSAEARAGEILIGAGISIEYHQGLMSEVAPGLKSRVLLAQALFSKPDVLLLDEPTNNLDINTIRWLEDTLNAKDVTMIIISHDRHFLNSVCTHMADLDNGTLSIYPGNYDEYMLASAHARERHMTANVGAKEKISELQEFVRRFSVKKSKARQATSRQKMVDKIKKNMVEVKPSSRQNPFIRFEQNKQLYSQSVDVQSITKSYDGGEPILVKASLRVEAGERVAIIGANGVGRSTFIKCIAGEKITGGHGIDSGEIRWGEYTSIGFMPQDTTVFFQKNMTLLDWMRQYRQPTDDEHTVRGMLGRLLFSGDEIGKDVTVLSGGEKARMFFGKLMLEKHNVLLLDEPTDHMDMEGIESLQLALEKFSGTLLFVSHDREFVSALASRIIEIKNGKIVDFKGSYDDYLTKQGIF